RWDAGWYVGIAMKGYEYDAGYGPLRMQRIVFFPAFPMAIRLLARPFGRHALPFFIAGTIVSVAAFCLALASLYLFARGHLDDRRATAALWLIAAYPFSVFFGAIYTESLFLLAMLGAFHHLRRQQWLAAAAFGVLLGLTKANGFVVAVPLAIAAVASD